MPGDDQNCELAPLECSPGLRDSLPLVATKHSIEGVHDETFWGCRYHGEEGMCRWVGLGVIANNLMSTATFSKARAAI